MSISHPTRERHQAISHRALAHDRRPRGVERRSRLRGQTDEVHSATRGKIDATIHALRDVSFEVKEGAGLGIIGRNGAGKTTLLKMISRVTWPTSGTVRVAGHVVSLIELGAGFHPGADRPRERLSRRRSLRADAQGDRSPVRRHRQFRRCRAVDRHADEALLVRSLRAARLQRRDPQQSRHRARRRSAVGRRRVVPAPRHGSAARADRVRQDGALHLARHVERPAAVQRHPVDGERQRARLRRGRRDRRDLHERGQPASDAEPGDLAAESPRRHRGSPLRAGRSVRRERRAGRDLQRRRHAGDSRLLHGVEGGRVAGLPGRDRRHRHRRGGDDGEHRERPAGQQATGDRIVEGPGEIEIRFAHLPLRPRQYVLRLSITDAFQLASYDVVTAGPRFAITGQGAGVDSLADEQDGLVTLPFEVVAPHRPWSARSHR